jgi:hypothetical protein
MPLLWGTNQGRAGRVPELPGVSVGGLGMAAELFTWFLILTLVSIILFVAILLLPGVIELLAESIDEMRWAIGKLKDALRGDKDGN